VIQVRRQTFEDVLADKTIVELPVVFQGAADQAVDYMNAQPGFVRKDAPKYLFGAYWYNKEERVCLLPT
jgi:hypothetical protein